MERTSQELVHTRVNIVTELAVAKNYLQSIINCLEELSAENGSLVGSTHIGDRMTCDLKAAFTHLDEAFASFAEASRIAQTLDA